MASDIASYALDRVREDRTDPSDHVTRALNQIFLDTADQLIDVKKNVAICIADQKRLLKVVASETTNARERAGRAALASEQGQHKLAREASVRASAHEQAAEGARSAADKLGGQIEALKRELRLFNEAVEGARIAIGRLRMNELSRAAYVRAEHQTRRIQELVSVLTAITALQQGAEERHNG